MTTEAYPGAPQFTVSGTGPYAVNHEYTSGALRPVVVLDGVQTELTAAQFSMDPEAGDSGNLTLTAQAASDFDGGSLTINRRTVIEQGWIPDGGAREAGLSEQLDRHSQGIQENQARGLRALRVVGAEIAEFVPEDGKAVIWDAALGAFVPGPTADDIADAQLNAETATQKAAEAAQSAEDAALFEPANFQPVDETLTSLSGLGTVSGKFAYTTDIDIWAEADVTVQARTFLAQATQSAQRVALGLGSAALMADSADTDLTENPDAAARRDIVKAYVDAAVIPVAGEIGSYVFARGSTTDVAFGGTIAGSDLAPTSAFVQEVNGQTTGTWNLNLASGSALTGTWRALGNYDYWTDGGITRAYGATLWQRIA